MDPIIGTDIAISLGKDCRPAYHLQANQLRKCSLPLDWMMGFSLETVLSLIRSDFSNFFTNITENVEISGTRLRRHIIDMDTGMIDTHQFLKKIPLDDGHREFLAVMRRRADRMISYLKNASGILFVSNRHITVADMESFIDDLNAMIPNQYRYMNVLHDPAKDPVNDLEISRNGSESAIQYCFNDTHPDPTAPTAWTGNHVMWKRVLGNVRLND